MKFGRTNEENQLALPESPTAYTRPRAELDIQWMGVAKIRSHSQIGGPKTQATEIEVHDCRFNSNVSTDKFYVPGFLGNVGDRVEIIVKVIE